jgi:hypothetical protein
MFSPGDALARSRIEEPGGVPVLPRIADAEIAAAEERHPIARAGGALESPSLLERFLHNLMTALGTWTI